MTTRIIFSFSVLFMFSGCFGMFGSDSRATTAADRIEGFMQEKTSKEKNNGASEVVADKEEDTLDVISLEERKAATVYADIVCTFSNPRFWEEFYEVDAEPGANILDDQQFYEQHGYTQKDEAHDAIREHWGNDHFKSEVKRVVTTRCDNTLQQADLNIDTMLNQKSPEM